jgi:NADPH:quinone reductase-like Zn-dependent oxidoreductase
MNESMKALRFDRTGSLDHLKIEEVPRPEPGPGCVLVKIKAAALNPSDAKNVLGRMAETTLPRIPGRDFAGLVVVGSAAYPEGAEVFGTGSSIGFTRDGSHAEFIEVPVEAIKPKPKSLTFEQAACVGIPYLTAWRAVVEAASLQPQETILITGTAGAVGDAAARIAKRVCKATVIGVARRHEDLVRLRLADYVDNLVDLGSGVLAEQVRAETGGRGVDVLLDVVGGELFEHCLKCLALRGRQVAIASSGERKVTFDLIDFYHNESSLIGVDSIKTSFPDVDRIMGLLLPYFKSGDFAPSKELASVGFDGVLNAYRNLLEGRTNEKQVFVP